MLTTRHNLVQSNLNNDTYILLSVYQLCSGHFLSQLLSFKELLFTDADWEINTVMTVLLKSTLPKLQQTFSYQTIHLIIVGKTQVLVTLLMFYSILLENKDA